ncbi:MAG: penicillin-binding protein 1C, partial [Rhizobiaceae bacterium]|nr:penicillin-binding protein 1C [Rhizobiaceae bacterium]
MPRWRKIAAVAGLAILVAAAGVGGLNALDKAYPPPIAAEDAVSVELLDADGQLLRAFATPEGRWRLKTTSADVDPRFVEMLLAYEDR